MSNSFGGVVLPRDPEARTRLAAIAVVLSLVAGLVTLAFVAAAPAHASTTNVSIKNFSFNPQDVSIPVGSTVQWSNDETDGTVHSVTSDDGLFSQDLNPGDRFSWTFSKSGTFNVHCRFHTYITGTITVTDSSSSSTTSSTAAPSTTSTSAPASTTTSTTVPSSTTSSTTSTTAPDATTSTTTPGATTSTTAPESTTSTTAPSSSPSTTSTTAPSDDSILGGTVIPPADGALTGVFDALHGALVSVDDALAGGS